MIFFQDLQINDFQTYAETTQAYKISYEKQDSALVNSGNSSSAIYKYEVKKPKIKAPQTKAIYPITKFYAQRLIDGDAKERADIMNNINSVCLQNVKEAIAFSDENISSSLFAIIDEDISKLRKPTRRQLRLRKAFNENKKLSKKQTETAMKYSEYEIAENNKFMAFYTLGTIQNLSDKVMVKETGIQPNLHDSSVIEKIIYESKNNKDENLRAAALGTLHLIAKPSYNNELKQIFQSALSDKSKVVRDIAKESLQYLE